MFGVSVAEVHRLLQRCLALLKEWREKNRPRPHLDDKVVAAWNGLMGCRFTVFLLWRVLTAVSRRSLRLRSRRRSSLARRGLRR